MAMSGEITRVKSESMWRPQSLFSHTVQTATGSDQLNAEGGIAVDFTPLRHASTHLSFEGSQSESLSLWITHSKSGFLSTPKLEADLFSVRFVTSGSMVRRNSGGSEHIGNTHHAMLVSFEGMREAEASAKFSAVSATVTRQAVIAACRALDHGSSRALPRFAPVADATTTGMIALRHTLHALHRHLKAGVSAMDLVFPLMEEVLVYQMISVWPKLEGSDAQPATTSSRSVRRAIDYIEANLSCKLMLADIAGAAGVGVRALQMAFRQQVGCTPVQYLIDRRLDQVHAALQTSDETMTIRQIATQFGFVHMSDFSRCYRQRFGQTPTMSRRQ